ncbi:MAG: 16S rRNA (cytosine(1402)-N(4))-methyltransferase RsmH [Chromatiales bacterium]
MSPLAGAERHEPVLLDEVITALAVRSDGIFVDCTFGRGGHAREILKRMDQRGRLVVMDRDPWAAAAAQALAADDARLSVHHGSFGALEGVLRVLGYFGRVNGVLFDLGVSSPQLDQADRGFSFQREGPLDMRMDTTRGATAAQWLAQAGENEIADCLHRYGEERYARRIARAIVRMRGERPIATTTQLAGIAARAYPGWQRGQHPATRTFQAIRILINDELNELKQGLIQAVHALAAGGRLLVISFHSLEDRIVKQFMRRESGRTGPRDMPLPPVAPRLRLVGKPVSPRPEEIRANPRARSARLRVAERLA